MSDNLSPTERQRKALAFIRDYRARNNDRPPSVREVGEHLGYPHPNNAQYIVEQLKAKGLLEADEVGGSRGRPRAGLQVSLVIPTRGRVSCGLPKGRDEDDGDPLDLRAMFNRDDLAAFRAVGTSMIEAGILPRDWLIVREEAKPAAGETVIATRKGEMLCKKLKKRRGGLVLEPCNGAMEPIEVDAETKFIGVLHTVIRKV